MLHLMDAAARSASCWRRACDLTYDFKIPSAVTHDVVAHQVHLSAEYWPTQLSTLNT
jgi:hypothetical protein